MNKFIPIFFIFLAACSSLKPTSTQDALKPVQLEGEGRGRIGYFDQNYLFRFESVFQKKNWLLNLAIPMHGQETLVFENLDKKQNHTEMQPLEIQIDQEFKKQTKLTDLQNENIVVHIRSMVRFVEANKLGLKTHCSENKCFLDKEEFLITAVSDGVQVKKFINEKYFIEFSALYLENNFYSRTNFYLKKIESKENFFSLELFWKNK